MLILMILVVGIFKWRKEPKPKEAFDRYPEEMGYTKLARCQMACQGISEKDIKTIMKKGIINLNRSNRRAMPCPVYALQGRTNDNAYLRVLFSQCREVTEVVSFINLEQDVPCNCSRG